MKIFYRNTDTPKLRRESQGMAATVLEGTAPKQVVGNCAKHKRNSLFNV